MANNQFMAIFGPESVVTSVISETNSVKYKLCVRGSNAASAITDVEVTINDVDLIDRATQRGRGLNLAVIDVATGTLVEWKYYDIYASNNSVAVAAFRDYIAALPITRIVAIFSYDAMRSTDILDDYMTNTLGSLAWPGSKFINSTIITNVYVPTQSSYCAIYNSKLRKIVCENFVGNSPSSFQEDTRSFVEIVYDELDDVGGTGIPQRIIDDPTERTGDGSVYAVYTWPNTQTVGSGGDLNVGDILSLSGDLYQNQALTTAGGYAVLSVIARNSSNVIIGEKRIDSRTGTVGQFSSQSDYFTIPSTSATIGCTFYHFPSTVKTGVSKVKNVVLTKVSKIPSDAGASAIGVNGIRVNTIKERTSSGANNPIAALLSMPVAESGVASSKISNSGNFAEMDTILSDSTTYTSSSAASAYEIQRWGSLPTLASLGLKVGDKIIMSAEMARNATAIANSKYTNMTIDFYNSAGTRITGDSNAGATTIPDVYDFFKTETVIPAGTVSIMMRVVRGPSTISATGICMVRNVLYRVNRGA